jgi:hypothetical protein
MKKLFIMLVTAGIFLLFTGCQKDIPVVQPQDQNDIESIQQLIESLPVNPYWVARELVTRSEWPVENEPAIGEVTPRGIGINGYNREVVAEDIVHYTYTIGVGPGPYNRIGIHRVVRELSPNRPVKTDQALFYQHGDAKNFVGMMLPGLNSPTTPDDFGMAVFLARNGVDVWGIDQAWNLLPDDITDFAFMADWGLQKQQEDLRTAMAIARLARYLTGSGLDKMILAGYSSGVATGFAALNAETQVRAGGRNIKGYIPIDLPIKTDIAELQEVFESEYYRTQEILDNGDYEDFISFRMMGQMARNNPNDESPVFPGFTNLQAALFIGAGPIFGSTHVHYLAGVWEDDFPAGFQFLTNEQWFDFMEAAPLYEPALFINDYSVLMTEIKDSPFDDHFAEINVPILNFAGAGGMGRLTEYGISRIGSADVTHHIVQLYPTDEALFDFGHIDIFIANNAPDVAWPAILEWINAH